jgi:hypothetical protein
LPGEIPAYPQLQGDIVPLDPEKVKKFKLGTVTFQESLGSKPVPADTGDHSEYHASNGSPDDDDEEEKKKKKE